MESEQVNFELLQEVMIELQDRLPLLEDDMHQLERFRESPELIASAFRHVHTIKSDFAYCGATPIADFLHRLEDVLQSLRERRFLNSALIAEAVLQSLDRVRDMAMTLRSTRRFDETPLDGLLASIDELSRATSQAAADQAARHVLLAAHSPGTILQGASRWADQGTAAGPAVEHAIALGTQLCGALGARHLPWLDRANSQISIIRSLNRHYPTPLNDQALVLSVYWHDVAMLALPDTVFAKPPTPKDEGWQRWSEHPEVSAQWLLAICPGAEEAAVIVRQHHQWADGRGFPLRKMQESLHPGAQMLACADLFYEGVAGLKGEEYRRAALRAVFDIHGGLDTRFDALLINAFQAASPDWTHPPATGASAPA
ncbi:HD-GYP domain-containing protein [Chitinimonas naiadis]